MKRISHAQAEYLRSALNAEPRGVTWREQGSEFRTRDCLVNRGMLTQRSAYNSVTYTGLGVTGFRITDEGKAALAEYDKQHDGDQRGSK